MVRTLTWVVLAVLALAGWLALPGFVMAQAPVPSSVISTVTPIGVTWTTWSWHSDTLYALADDGEAIWVGAVGGVIRWDKAAGTYRRYTALDGLPQKDVRAVAVDGAGNRWFGGDGGVSRLAADGTWTHFTIANSGLASDFVDGIAVGEDGTLWASHGLPSGAISRRTPDGTWHSYASRTEAVVADYDSIRHTLNANRLWTVAGAEVWTGYQVFDGVAWHDRTPGVTAEPVAMAVDSTGSVWVLPNSTDPYVLNWNGIEWVGADLPDDGLGALGRNPEMLAVGPDDTVWVGGHAYFMYGPWIRTATYLWSLRPDSAQAVGLSAVTAMLPTTGGTWVAGQNGLLLMPSGMWAWFQDTPIYTSVNDVLVDGDGVLWLRSVQEDSSTLQTLRDQGTVSLVDDRWGSGPSSLSLSERTPAGDWWGGGREWTGQRWLYFFPLRRWYDRQWVEYSLPGDIYRESYNVCNVFAQDERHTWFVTQLYSNAWGYGWTLGPGPAFYLDDGGTPADLSDDIWTTLPFTTNGGSLAVDALGRLWFGDAAGLWRFHDGTLRLNDPRGGIRVLVPAADGTLFVQYGGRDVMTVWPDDSRDTLPLEQLIAQRYDLVRTATRRNRLWAVAPDGAVWYVTAQTMPGGQVEQQLHRRDAAGLTVYALPCAASAVSRIDVDRNNHVWLAASAALWRMTMPPDFRLAVTPDIFLLAPGSSRQAQVEVGSQEWFTGTVALAATGWPAGITATFDPNPVVAGNVVTLTVQADAGVATGVYPSLLLGQSGAVTHTIPLQAVVAPIFYDRWLPRLMR